MANKYLQYFTLTIAVVGAINWGLNGFFNFNLVAFLLKHELAFPDHLRTCRLMWALSSDLLNTDRSEVKQPNKLRSTHNVKNPLPHIAVPEMNASKGSCSEYEFLNLLQ